MNLGQALLIAIVQGATELFPVSSLGHAVVLPALLGWNLDQRGAAFLPFLVLLHVGTAAALFGFFAREWWTLGLSVLGIGPAHQVREGRRVVRLLVVATIPAVIAGLLLEHVLRAIFGTPVLASLFLVANGVLLLACERLRLARAASGTARPASTLGTADALVIGLWQCLALLPGISRSGATIVGGLLRGIDHEGSAHFSFLIALPIILAATVREVPRLLHADVPPGTFTLAAEAAVVAGLVALASTAALMRWFRGHDRWALAPFGIYCIVAGAVSFLYLHGV
jgi:undecaprenyl-diphosphatase